MIRIYTISLSICLSFILNFESYAQEKRDCFVQLNNGKTIPANYINVKSPFLGKAHLLIDGKQKINLLEVEAFQNAKGYFIYDFVGNSLTKKILRREIIGNIDTYSYSYTAAGVGGFTAGAGTYVPTTHRVNKMLFKKGSGPLQKTKLSNLKIAMADNPESMKLLKQVGNSYILDGTLWAAGLAMVIGGILHSEKKDRESNISTNPNNFAQQDSFKMSPFFYIGGVVATIPFFTYGLKDRKKRKAILIYNK